VTTQIDSSAYTSATIDTSRVYDATGWSQHFIYVEAQDTVSCVVGVLTSRNGLAFAPVQNVDSLVVLSGNAGGGKTIDISSKVNGCYAYKVTLGFTSGGKEGLSSPRYSAYISRKTR